ncbi:DUF1501 domain-containing protein [Ideonella sp. DXS22W]|uniref:DUF1501 domain-containing protein n=1 Tax=Pseudaquabacterium inlustre TaxID=2984192 RepID=A0ABU9CJZ1_9BURK
MPPAPRARTPNALPTSGAAGIGRRRLMGAALGAGLLPAARLSVAGQAGAGAPRLALVILRGGLDGLAAVPVPGDPAFANARGALAAPPATAATGAPLRLDDTFALHPALGRLHALYQQGDAAVLHAVGLPYQERSHFDAQQLLESGGRRPFELDSGWLGRVLAELPGAPAGSSAARGLALQAAVPLVLRGNAVVDTWLPPQRNEPAPDALADLGQRVAQLYAGDAALAAAFERARRLHAPGPEMAAQGMASGAGPAGNAARLAALGTQAAAFLTRPDGPQTVVLEMGGWDTHANQANALAGNLAALDALLDALHQGLAAATSTAGSGPAPWARTLVLVVTEFGRTVAPNGTQGTDHGSGAAAFALGGAVRGGRVLADWPGLAPRERTEGRDLRSTTDLRALFKTALHQHLGLPLATVHGRALPGSEHLGLLPLLRS